MRTLTVVSIVEGHGEVTAVPVLLRRVFESADLHASGHHLVVPPPIRLSRSSIARADTDFMRAVELAARKAGEAGAILILLDADDDCPAELCPRLLETARAQRSDRPIAVIAATREYEAWFLAAAESLRGHRGVAHDAVAPADPEKIRGAKERLRELLGAGESYLETSDQAALTAAMDLDQAANAPSFGRCRRRIADMLSVLATKRDG